MSRGGGLVGSGASRASGVPSIEASLNAQIEDLVQRNRTLDHTNKKLAEEMALEADRAKRAIRDVQTKWHEEKHVWREGCNRLLSCHHLAHLRLSAKLSSVEAALLKEMELCRQEKVARLHRDFQITMFRHRESELDAKIEKLEDELEEERHKQDTRFSQLEERINAQDEEIASLNEEKLAIEAKLLELREAHSRLQVSSESTASKLERMTLQYDGAKTTNTELERQNDELKRANVGIKNQIEKWRSLETKGGAEVETMRKKRIDLEVEVKALEDRLEKKEGELQKEKAKVTRYKQSVGEFEAHANEQRQEAKDAVFQLTKANKQLERLKQELEAERAARPISPQKRQASPTVSEEEVAQDFADEPPPSSPPAKPPPSKKAKSKTSGIASTRSGRNKPVAGPSNASNSDIEEVTDPRKRVKAKAPDAEVEGVKKSRAKPRSRTAGRESSDNEDNTKVTKKKAKGKAKAVEESGGSDAELVQEEPSRPATRGKRKKDEVDPEDVGDKGRASSQVPEAAQRSRPSKPHSRVGSGSRAGSVQPRGTTAISEDEDEPARKKKKRTIGIFPANSQPTSFNFLATLTFGPKGDTGGGINIPTVLSPVKESDIVPSRSGVPNRAGSSSSLIGSIGGILASSFTRRR
ncbi:hypothetical protein B0H10DRAFT_2188902 [Mycena sp. CBHHK59/15]|nr:hypothetical protein B0H10DRAFT_2188902 [Mycena sp. CBHHK59/15]